MALVKRDWIKTLVRILLGLLIGAAASAVFLLIAFRFWESLIRPLPLHVTETRRTVIFFVEIGIYCAAGLVFGIVNSLFISRAGRDVQLIVGTTLAFIILLPFMFIEGHLVPPMLFIALAISATCGFSIKAGQFIVFSISESWRMKRQPER